MRTVVSALVLACGCYHASFEQNVPCSADLSCPGSEVCDTSKSPPVCVDQLGSGSASDASPVDAMVTACGVCANPKPVCDTDSTTCRGCYDDGECGSGVCVEYQGTCVPEPLALYVRNGGSDSGTCTRAQPCSTITRALALVDDTRKTIKIYDGNYRDAFTTSSSFILSGENDGHPAHIFYKAIQNHDHLVEIDGGTSLIEGVTLDGGTRETVRVQGGANVEVFEVEMLDSSVGTIDMAGSTVALDQCTLHDNQGTEAAINQTEGQLTVEQSVVYSASGPCVKVQGSFMIENSFFLGCVGAGLVQYGTAMPMQIFQFNTVANNGTGAQCATPIAIANTIFATNGAASPQIVTPCTATYSLFTDVAPAGTGNISNGNPAFVAADDFHITFQSQARDKADPAATLDFDFDDETRPHGPARDIGADEHY